MARRKKKNNEENAETGMPASEEVDVSAADVPSPAGEADGGDIDVCVVQKELPENEDGESVGAFEENDATAEDTGEEDAGQADAGEEDASEAKEEEQETPETGDEAEEGEGPPDTGEEANEEEENGEENEEEENGEGGSGEEEDGEEPEEGETPDTALPLASIVEAVLFAAREPLKLVQLARAVGKRTRQDAVREALAELNVQYLETGRAFEIAEVSGRYQLMSRPEYSEHIMRIYPKKELAEKDKTQRLTPAMLDTLAIIAYKQPVMRSEIEHIRGVSCSNALRSLIERGSVKEMGRRVDLVGKPAVFGTTDNFLIEFGLGSLEELPMRNDFIDPGSPPPVELSVLENTLSETGAAEAVDGGNAAADETAEPGVYEAAGESEEDGAIPSEPAEDEAGMEEASEEEPDEEIDAEIEEDGDDDNDDNDDDDDGFDEDDDLDEEDLSEVFDDDDDGDDEEEEDASESEEVESAVETDAEEDVSEENEDDGDRRDETNLPF